MIDFSKYSVNEQQAINDVLYDLQKYLYDNDMKWDYLHNAFFCSTTQLRRDIDLQAEQAEQAGEAPADPPAEDPEPVPDMFGWVSDALDDLCAAGEVLGSDE